MNKVILHVGMHKTGSTSIQKSLEKSEEVIYPKFEGCSNHNFPLYCLFKKNEDVDKRAVRRSAVGKPVMIKKDEWLANLEKNIALASKEQKTLILSSEGLYSDFDKDELAQIKTLLSKVFSEIKVLMYIRHPLEYLSSVFQQKVKTSGIADFKTPSDIKLKIDYLDNLDEVFGKNNVEIIKFSKETLVEGDVVKDFYYRVGINNPVAEKANSSIGKSALSLLYVLNKSCSGDYSIGKVKAARKWIIKNLNKNEGVFLFSSDILNKFYEKNRKEIESIEERMGFSLVSKSDDPDGVSSEKDLMKTALSSLLELKEKSESIEGKPKVCVLRVIQYLEGIKGSFK